jgi:hypothetical protein
MKENRLGALWLSTSSKDRAPFAKGVIEISGGKIPIVIWKNGWKEQDLASDDQEKRARAHKQPDFYIEMDQRTDGQTTPQNSYRSATQNTLPGMNHGQAPARPMAPPPRAPQTTSGGPNSDQFDDDIPF